MINPSRYWRPTGDADRRAITIGRLPEPGQLIVHTRTRKAWRVISIDDIHPANWTQPTHGVWESEGQPDPLTWPGRERRILVEPPRNPQPDGKDRRGIRVHPWWRDGEEWRPLTDPYPVCPDCALVWPCPCDDRNKVTAQAMAELDRLGAIMPGCCWHCAEPITSRQDAVTYPGDNLDLPGGHPVRFHTRRGCAHAAKAYELRWIDADPRRERVLTWPQCGATLIVHRDGSTECDGDGAAPDCGGYATHDHRNRSACYAATRGGCARGCSPTGHPGTRTPPRPPRRQNSLI